MHVSEYLSQKVKRNAFASIEISLFLTVMGRDKRKFVMFILSNPKLNAGPGALLQDAFDILNLPGIAAQCPGVNLLVVEKITCDIET